jgi:hypothetical protein
MVPTAFHYFLVFCASFCQLKALTAHSKCASCAPFSRVLPSVVAIVAVSPYRQMLFANQAY